jgi:hypothetical protein
VVLPLVEGRQAGWPAWSWAVLAAALERSTPRMGVLLLLLVAALTRLMPGRQRAA